MLPKLKKKKKPVVDTKKESRLDLPVVHTNASSIETIDAAMYTWVNENKKYWEGNALLVTARSVISINHALRSAGAIN